MAKQGQGLGNDRALKHGCYRSTGSLIHDARTREAKMFSVIEAGLIQSLGGDDAISPQQALIIKRAAFKALRCGLAEAEMIRADSYWSSKNKNSQASKDAGEVAQSLRDDYLAWSRELRTDLLALGLNRKARQLPSLQDYMKQQKDKTIEVSA